MMPTSSDDSAATRICRRCGARLKIMSRGSVCPACMFAATEKFERGEAVPPPESRGEEPMVFGDYLLEKELAHGGMGVVFRARQVSLNRTVAVKLLLLGRYSSAESLQRFRREAQSAALLRHPGIVAIHEIGECEGQPFIAMEYVDGGSLAELVRARARTLPPRRAAEIIRAVALALHHAHEQGVIHRDVKPSNLLFDARGEVRVTDFGLAKKLDGSTDLTLSGNLAGTVNSALGDVVNFTTATYPIAGRITDSLGSGVPVVVSATGGFSGTSDAAGYYLIPAVTPGARTVTPSKGGVVFTPANRSATVPPAATGVDFSATSLPPTITTIADVVIAKGTATGALRFDVNDVETRPGLLTVAATSSDPLLVPAGGIALGGVGQARTITLTPDPTRTGTAAITLTVTDESGLSATTSFALRVNAAPIPGAGRALSFDGTDDAVLVTGNVFDFKGNYAIECDSGAYQAFHRSNESALSRHVPCRLGNEIRFRAASDFRKRTRQGWRCIGGDSGAG